MSVNNPTGVDVRPKSTNTNDINHLQYSFQNSLNISAPDPIQRASSAQPYQHHSNQLPLRSSTVDTDYNYYPPQESYSAPPYHHHQQQQQQWQQQNQYLYAAASDVLGGPPPQQQHQYQMPPDPSLYSPSRSSGYAPSINSVHSSNSSNYPPSSSSPYPPQYHPHHPHQQPQHYPPAHGYSDPYSQQLSPPPQQHQQQQQHQPEFDRPAYNRNDSIAPSTNTGKAVDLNAPPYTKDYIDSYRQRLKADPDPEAHFLYAKYLIDAAKHLRMTQKDQRSAKKYSEVLITESLKVVRRLATQGETYDEAQFFMANCYGTGALGLQVDHERAYHLYLQATKQNHAAATYRVAVCNEIGAGTKKDPQRAATFYRKAATLGDTPAMYKLGMILLNGLLGEQPNPREAVSWLKRAAEQADEENPHALHELALLHELPDGRIVPHDPAYAKQLLTQAAQLGYIPSQYKLGQCYEYGSLTCPLDPRRSIAWYTKAAEKGDAEAELALSGWYLTGSEGVLKQSDSEAYLWARRAANKGLSKAEYAVGYYAEVGIGIKQDIEFAKRWYMRAAAQGNKRAMARLTEMKRMGAKRQNIARPTRQEASNECVIC